MREDSAQLLGPTAQLAGRRILEVAQFTSISDAILAQMVQLGIYSRTQTEAEHRTGLFGSNVFEQLIEDETADADEYVVVETRLAENAVKAALATYKSIFLRKDGTSRVPELQQALGESYRSYSEKNNTAEASGYVAYLAATSQEPASAVALDCIRQLGHLFIQIKNLGLTSKELDISKSALLRPLRVPGLSTGALRQTIESTTASGLSDSKTAALPNLDSTTSGQ